MSTQTLLILLLVGVVAFIVLGKRDEARASPEPREQSRRGGTAPADAEESLFDSILNTVAQIIETAKRVASGVSKNT